MQKFFFLGFKKIHKLFLKGKSMRISPVRNFNYAKAPSFGHINYQVADSIRGKTEGLDVIYKFGKWKKNNLTKYYETYLRRDTGVRMTDEEIERYAELSKRASNLKKTYIDVFEIEDVTKKETYLVLEYKNSSKNKLYHADSIETSKTFMELKPKNTEYNLNQLEMLVEEAERLEEKLDEDYILKTIPGLKTRTLNRIDKRYQAMYKDADYGISLNA